MVEISQKRLDRIKRLKILDDEFAKIFFKDRECVRTVVETLLQRKVNIVHHETEGVIEVVGGRNIEYDIYVLSDTAGIDIELENNRFRLTPKRVRYHKSTLDTHLSNPGMDIRDLMDIVIIFICAFDPLHLGKPYYHVDSVVRENGQIFDDGTSIILVNGTYQGDDPIGKLVHDFRTSNPDKMYNEVLKQRAKYFKEDKGGISTMCEIWEEEREEGRKEIRLESIINIMANLNMTLKEAMKALGLPLEDEEMYRKML